MTRSLSGPRRAEISDCSFEPEWYLRLLEGEGRSLPGRDPAGPPSPWPPWSHPSAGPGIKLPSEQRQGKKSELLALTKRPHSQSQASYSRAAVCASGGVPPHAVAGLVQRRGALHLQGPVQASVGEHGVADTWQRREEEKGGGEVKGDVSVWLFLTEESFGPL